MKILVIILLCGIIDLRLVNGRDDISRINHGVFFKFIRADKIVNRLWRHTFIIDIPLEIIGHKHHDLLGNDSAAAGHDWYVDCIHKVDKSVNTRHINPNITRGTGWNYSNEYSDACLSLKEELEIAVRQVREKHTHLRDLTEKIESLLPSEIPSSWKTRGTETRNARSLIPLIGKAASSLFGVATEEQLDVVANHVDEVLKMSRDQNKIFGKLSDDLTSYSKVVGKRIDGLVSALQTSTLASHKIMANYQGRLNIRETAAKLEERKDVLLWEMSKVETHLEQFRQGLQLLNMGYLPSEIITPAMMTSAIASIGSELSPGEESFIHFNPARYYRKASFIHARIGNQLTVMVEFPLTRYQGKFSSYEVILNDMIIPENQDSVMRLKTDVKGILLGQVGRGGFQGIRYVELSNWDVIDLRRNAGHGNQHRMLRIDGHRNCLVSIFRDDINKIKENCQYIILPGKLVPSVLWLHKSSFLVTAVDEYRLIVGNWTMRKRGCKQCLVMLPDKSVMETDDFQAYAEYALNNTAGRLYHTVNKPFVSHFFSEGELSIIRGDSLYSELPVFKLPPMNLQKPNNSVWVAEDKVLKLEMNRVVESVKADRDIIHTLADKLYEETKLGPGNFSTWQDWSIVGIGGTMILITILLIYIISRLRYLCLAIAVLNQACGVTAGFTLQYQPTTTPLADMDALNQGALDNLIWMSGSAWAWVCAGFVAGIIFTTVIWILKARCCGRMTVFETTLALNVVGRDRGKIVPLLKCHVPGSDLEVRTNEAPSHLEVKGLLSPRLSFNWENDIIMKSLRLSRRVPTSVALSVADARELKKLFAQEHQVIPVFIEGDRISTIPGLQRQTVKSRRSGSLSSTTSISFDRSAREGMEEIEMNTFNNPNGSSYDYSRELSDLGVGRSNGEGGPIRKVPTAPSQA